MTVTVQRAKGSTFIGKGPSNHWVVIDTEKHFGGSESGSHPMELVLIALGGCTAIDVETIIKEMRIQVNDLRIEITSEREQEHPKVYTKIHLQYSFQGKNLNEDFIKKAVELSQNKYCPITAMLKKSAEITYEIKINKP